MISKYFLLDTLLLGPDTPDSIIIKRVCQILGRDESEMKASARRTIAEMEEQIAQIKKRFDI